MKHKITPKFDIRYRFINSEEEWKYIHDIEMINLSLQKDPVNPNYDRYIKRCRFYFQCPNNPYFRIWEVAENIILRLKRYFDFLSNRFSNIDIDKSEVLSELLDCIHNNWQKISREDYEIFIILSNKVYSSLSLKKLLSYERFLELYD